MKNIELKLQKLLDKRHSENSLRKLDADFQGADFFSNDYLGLAHNKELNTIIHNKSIELFDDRIGSTGSRLLSGNHQFIEGIEKELASLFKKEAALIFNSGYSANIGLMQAIPQRGDTIIYDSLIHASLKEGARLSLANKYSFKHNDLDDLKKKLIKATGEVFVVVESIYSMDGDNAPLLQLAELSKTHDFNLIVDEAHSTGVFGQGGAGLCVDLGIEKDVFACVYTFGKGIGGHGACIAGSKTLINFLINYARSFIYTTALSFHSYVAIQQAFKFLAKEADTLQQNLKEKILLFKKHIGSLDGYIDSNSGIQVLKIGGIDKTKNIAAMLQAQGFGVKPILSPTVKKGEERLRFCLHVYNTEKEIIELTKLINSLL